MNPRDHDEEFPETATAVDSALGSIELAPETRARHLHRLREHAAILGAPVGAPVPAASRARRAAWTLRRRAAAVAGAVTLTAGMGSGVAVAASHDALPGESLYGVKQLAERIQLALPGDTATDVERRLSLAARRLDEAQALRALSGRAVDPALMGHAIAAAGRYLDESAELAADDDALGALVRDATTQAQARLTALLDGGLPPEAAEPARQALERVRQRLEGTPAQDGGRGPGGRGSGAPAAPGAPGATNRPEGDDGPGRGMPPGVPANPGAGPPAPGNTGAGGDAGRPESAGPPEDTDPPETVGPPQEGGPPDGAGPPEATGPPDTTGSSQDSGPSGQGGSSDGSGAGDSDGPGDGDEGSGGPPDQAGPPGGSGGAGNGNSPGA